MAERQLNKIKKEQTQSSLFFLKIKVNAGIFAGIGRGETGGRAYGESLLQYIVCKTQKKYAHLNLFIPKNLF